LKHLTNGMNIVEHVFPGIRRKGLLSGFGWSKSNFFYYWCWL